MYPEVLRAEVLERSQQAAQAAVKKVENALDRKVSRVPCSCQCLRSTDLVLTSFACALNCGQEKEAEKFAGLAALPPIEVALADKYSQWDPAAQEFTHSKEGVVLDAKVGASGDPVPCVPLCGTATLIASPASPPQQVGSTISIMLSGPCCTTLPHGRHHQWRLTIAVTPPRR
jgi:hypothetical protein